MALLQIRYEEDEILRKKSREISVEDILLKDTQKLIDDMIFTMHKYNGVGLAAVQVGRLKQIVVIDVSEEENKKKNKKNKENFENKVYVLINPKILKTEGQRECEEGCLSFPNEFGKVKRPKKVVVEYFERTGKKQQLEAEGLLAQAICHEVDHLNGIVFKDLVIPGTLEVVTDEK